MFPPEAASYNVLYISTKLLLGFLLLIFMKTQETTSLCLLSSDRIYLDTHLQNILGFVFWP